MATIEKRVGSDGKPSYRVKIRVKGYPPESATFDRLTDAREWATRTESDMRAGRFFGSARLHTFNALADEYERAAHDLKSFPDRRRHLMHWRAEFGAALLNEITPQRIALARDRLLAGSTRYKSRATGDPNKDAARVMGTRSGPTVNRYLATLSACLSFAVKTLGWLERNPCERTAKNRENPGRVRFLTESEIPRLLDACRPSPDLYLAVVLSLTTGARQAEIMGLRWPQLDLSRRLITLRQGATKNGDARALPISGEAGELLRERAKVRSLHDDRVFPPVTLKGQSRSLREGWRRALLAAGIEDFRWHDLRHTAASYLAMSGRSQVEIAKVLGHRTLAMVARYSHLDPAHVVAMGDTLAEKLSLAGRKPAA